MNMANQRISFLIMGKTLAKYYVTLPEYLEISGFSAIHTGLFKSPTS